MHAKLSNHPTTSLPSKVHQFETFEASSCSHPTNWLFFDAYSARKLFTASTLSPFSSLEYARKVFDEIPEPNLYMWNTLIRAYSWSPEPSESVKIFLRMLCESPYFPNKFTFPFLIKAATKLSRLGVGQVFHGLVVKSSLVMMCFILNSLIHFYASCGDLDFAYRVFVRIGEKDVVSWNSMISRFVQGGCFDKALELFKEMEAENVKPNAVTKVGVLSACTKMKDLEFGRWVRSYIEQKGIKMDLTLSNAMLDIQETATWNALISAYDQNGKPQEALAIFHQLQLSKNTNPDELTFVSTLSSYTSWELWMWGGRAAIDLFYRRHEAKVKPNALLLPMSQALCLHGRTFLGRSRLLGESVEFKRKCLSHLCKSVWGLYLGACKIHDNVELAAAAACSRLLDLNPKMIKALVLLSNIYAKTENWDNASY
ncbi:hypothetical protein EZV62_002922 [Acer yangbiense]|uniref:Pentacotripeptide-repeat region of PRORP domain-containing protein n=1 Tax=Acer yangbiense TaxID=1000413 RepID=A0A5C7IYP9_9ROSI|nr:hypothetical protein EZV62_002922 [Acer yangbiense]